MNRTTTDTAFRDVFHRWLTSEGRSCKSVPLLVDSYCRLLNGAGFGIRRCNLATDTVHPQMTGTRHVWFSEYADPGPINPAVVVRRQEYRLGDALIDEIFFNAGSQTSPQYLVSPFYRVEVDGELHAAIRPHGEDQPYPVFRDLAEIGCTDYFGMRLDAFAGILQKIGLSTDLDGGFSGEQVDDLRWSLGLFTLLLNTLIEFNIKNTLAGAYLGLDPGKRVCLGMIALGDVVSLEAAIWFSDIRDFTTMSDGLGAEQLIATLNAYFDAVVGAIYANGGEVLKYIGDAVLAVFPVRDFDDAPAACRAALAAAGAARKRLAALNVAREADGLDPIRDGVALHHGVAEYGNIGAGERLDFTLIGREVNVASRIESLTKKLGEPLLCSEAFRDIAGVPMRPVGRRRLKGIRDAVGLFAPGDGGPAALVGPAGLEPATKPL